MLIEVRLARLQISTDADDAKQFRLLSKPYSIIRNITLRTIDILDAASVNPSRDTRIVLSSPTHLCLLTI